MLCPIENDNSPARDDELFIPSRTLDELHALIDVVPDAMVVVDAEGIIRSFSKGAESMFGFEEAEVQGENASMLMPSPDREKHDFYIQRYHDTGLAHVIGRGRITTARHRDGTTFPINISVGQLNFDGAIGFAAFIRDLTESRETERELHILQNELAHVSRISAMGTLATSLAHELNQPLTAISNFSQSASDLLADPSGEHLTLAREALDECAHEALRAGRIVRRLREFISKGETQKGIASLRRLVKEASALALMNGHGRGVDFETILDPDADEVLVDAVQIQQVVVNLINNALEAMIEADHRRLRVSSCNRDNELVELVVADSGPGLEPHIAERLFHPFNTSKESGLGLGLSICHTIITAHGGKLWVEPSELGGTAFHLLLPAASTGSENG